MPQAGGRAAYQEVNESIRRLAATGGSPLEEWEFFCECDDVRCRVLVSLTLSEFDERRSAEPARPILATHHAA
jgi:hypothetical protein